MKSIGLAFAVTGTLAVVAAVAASLGTSRAGSEAQPLGSCAGYSGLPSETGPTAGMTFIPSGSFTMGSNTHMPEERFTHIVRLEGFWIDRHEVTNAQFKQFVDATGYRTLAERRDEAKASAAGESLVSGSFVFVQPTDVRGNNVSQWWKYVPRASWREPAGPGSSIAGKDNHPVIHIAYEDALAYATWRGHSLPTEAQWEYAARGGRDGEDDWSSAFDTAGKPIANTWQGIFPLVNSNDDGYTGAAPVGCFKANGYGLYDMIGNVWEWTGDWYRAGHNREMATNPSGPQLVSLRLAPGQVPARVIKGGSYLCAHNYCERYRPAARQPQEHDLSTSHIGFRTVLNAQRSPNAQ